MIITISGRPGSGKSVVASRVAEELGLDHVSAGDFMREMAAERGISILELSRAAEQRQDIDREIDARTMRLARERDNFVMDARLGWHFIPDSIKVFLEVDPAVAARRIYEAQRGSEHENVTLEDTERACHGLERAEMPRIRRLAQQIDRVGPIGEPDAVGLNQGRIARHHPSRLRPRPVGHDEDRIG